jgi:hypothetical protein
MKHLTSVLTAVGFILAATRAEANGSAVIPEPSTIALMGIGIGTIAVAGYIRKRRK